MDSKEYVRNYMLQKTIPCSTYSPAKIVDSKLLTENEKLLKNRFCTSKVQLTPTISM